MSIFSLSPSYSENANNVQQEQTIFTVGVVMLDFSPLKSSLVQHCHMWQTKFTELLSQLATARLQELYASIHDNTNRCVYCYYYYCYYYAPLLELYNKN